MSPDPKWNPTDTTLAPATARYRPAPRRRRVPKWIWLGVPVAVVATIVALVVVLAGFGYFGGTVSVNGVSVAYSPDLLNGSAPNASYSGPTGSLFIVEVWAWDNASAPTEPVDYPTACITGATVSPGSFTVRGITPNLCLAGQNSSHVFVTLGLPSRPFHGSISLNLTTTTEYQYD
jgi:hypothetical protein